jgi:type I restriction enzyme S subunit
MQVMDLSKRFWDYKMGKLEKYSSYKDSGVEWLGEIPEGWEIQKLKFNSKIETGNSISDGQKGNYENIEDESYPYIATKDINYDFSTIDYSNGLRIPTSNKNFKISNPDTTLICIEGGSAGKKIAFNTQKICFVNKLASIQSINSNIPKFLYYLTKSYIFKKQFDFSMNGLIGGVSISTMKNFELIFPPKQEQTKIASFLDEKTAQIDEVISQKQKLIELLKERKQIVINDAVTKGLDKNVEFVDSGVEWIGEIPKHWEVKKLKYIFNFNKGLTITKENLQEEGIFCVNYGEIHSKYGFEVNPRINYLKCVNESYLQNNKNSLLDNGDFIFADTSEDIEGSGNFTYLNSDLQTFAGYHTIICRPKNDIFSRFFAYEFESLTFRNQIRSKVKGVKVYSITQGLLKDLTIWLPPKDEQLKIVEYIETQTTKIDIAIELQQNYISKLGEYKASLIDSVVTGKVRVG